MKTIFKYKLQIQDQQVFEIPLSGHQFKILQGDFAPFLYCIVDTDAPMRRVIVTIVGTGNPVPDDCSYWVGIIKGTIKIGSFIWHVFVRTE